MASQKILTTSDYYLPGYKAGGPLRTLANMVDKLGHEFQFKIITTDRDIYETKPYAGVRINGWNRFDKEEVFYMSPTSRSLRDFKKLLGSTEYDVLYLNSFFSIQFTIKPLLLRRLQLLPEKPVILAPRGELSPGALSLKRVKKRVYLWVSKFLGLYRGVTWQASSEYEETDIRRWFGKDVPVVIAPNLPPKVPPTNELSQTRAKRAGGLKIVFLSRISRMKNLDSALKTLEGLNGKIRFSIYGPMEDKVYWSECERIIRDLPSNIVVRYYGSVPYDEVGRVLREHDLFYLPTMGENFGHVILEALCAGCPVLISDQTPWRDLQEKGVGWDISLSKLDEFQIILQRCIDMDHEDFIKRSDKARDYGLDVSNDDVVVEQNRKLFSAFIAGD